MKEASEQFVFDLLRVGIMGRNANWFLLWVAVKKRLNNYLTSKNFQVPLKIHKEILYHIW